MGRWHGDDVWQATSTGVRIIAIQSDGSQQNITEGVEALYDLLVQSMDWGSGFLTVEDAVPVAKLAATCGFLQVDEAARYLGVSKEALADVSAEDLVRRAKDRYWR